MISVGRIDGCWLELRSRVCLPLCQIKKTLFNVVRCVIICGPARAQVCSQSQQSDHSWKPYVLLVLHHKSPLNRFWTGAGGFKIKGKLSGRSKHALKTYHVRPPGLSLLQDCGGYKKPEVVSRGSAHKDNSPLPGFRQTDQNQVMVDRQVITQTVTLVYWLNQCYIHYDNAFIFSVSYCTNVIECLWFGTVGQQGQNDPLSSFSFADEFQHLSATFFCFTAHSFVV